MTWLHRQAWRGGGGRSLALAWIAVFVVLDQIWLRVILHESVSTVAHPVRLGGGRHMFYTGIWQACVHAGLLGLCLMGSVGIVWRGKRRDEIP